MNDLTVIKSDELTEAEVKSPHFFEARSAYSEILKKLVEDKNGRKKQGEIEIVEEEVFNGERRSVGTYGYGSVSYEVSNLEIEQVAQCLAESLSIMRNDDRSQSVKNAEYTVLAFVPAANNKKAYRLTIWIDPRPSFAPIDVELSSPANAH